MSSRNEIMEIEKRLALDFISQQMNSAREKAQDCNEKMKKAVDIWKGVYVCRCFVAWLRLLRKKRRQREQLHRAAPISCDLSHTESDMGSVESTHNTLVDKAELLDSLDAVEVQQERIQAACRLLQSSKK
jgi:hypothetical protein